MEEHDINWGYWNWYKRRYKKPEIMIVETVDGQPILRHEKEIPIINNRLLVNVIESMAEKIENLDADILALNAKAEKPGDFSKLENMESKIDMLARQMRELQKNTYFIRKEFVNFRNDLSTIRSDVESLGELVITEIVDGARGSEQMEPQVKNEIKIIETAAIPVVKNAHKRLVNYLITKDSLIGYEEIALDLRIAKSSVRVYVADLQNWGFPIIKSEIDRKIMVGIVQEDAQLALALLDKYSKY